MRPPNFIRACVQVLFVVALILVGCQVSAPAAIPIPNKDQEISTLKLIVDEPGIYRLTGEKLEAAGFLVDDAHSVQVSVQGHPIPTWVEGAEDGFSIKFYGVLPDSPYTRSNVYWLTQETRSASLERPASSRVSNDPSKDLTPAYLTKMVLEEKKIFSPFIPDDPWYWMAIPAPGKQKLEIEMGEIASETARLNLSVWGATKSPEPFDHHLRVIINDMRVLDEWWDGSGAYHLSAEIPPDILRSGRNVVEVDAPGDTGAIADNVFIQRIEFLYHRLDAGKGQTFLIGEGAMVQLSALGGAVDVYDVTQPDQPAQVVDVAQSDGVLGFFAEQEHHYLAVSDQAYLVPKLEVPHLFPDLSQSTTGAEYLVVGPAVFLDALEPLLALRKAQGLSTFFSPLEAVYDQYNYGLPEPEAIHRFVLFAAAYWQIKPRYLLLLGDASYDPKGYLADPGVNQLPIYLINTQYGGLTGSDLPYVDVDNDHVPDLAVGRIPARTSTELEDWVNKTLAYEQALENPQPLTALAVADGQEASFRQDAQLFLDALSSSFQVELYAPAPDVQDATAQISGFFEAGFQLIGYFGHGSLNMWGRDRLFSPQDIPADQQDRYPIVLTMTCLNGFFIHPSTTSLAEALIFSPDGGAVAVLAPTSLTTAWDQQTLGENLYLGLAEPGDRRLGDILLDAQQKMPLNLTGQLDVLLTFLLFGDPALRLRGS